MALVSLGLVYVALLSVAAFNPDPAWWGGHAAAYLGTPARIAMFAPLVLGLSLLGWNAWQGTKGAAPKRVNPPNRSARTLPSWVIWAVLPVLGSVFWMLRVRSYLLGDQALWIERLREGQRVVYSEPLAAWSWHAFRDLLQALGRPIDPGTLALLPAFCGALAVLLALAIGRELAGPRAAYLIAGIISLAGASQLYFGYIETYPIAAVSILLYVWLGLRFLNGAIGIWAPAAALGISISAHLAGLYLAPSFLWLVLRRPNSLAGRLVSVSIPVLLVTATFSILRFDLGKISRPVAVIWTAVSLAGRAAGGHAPTLAPLRIAADLGNTLLLVAPVPWILALIGVASWITKRRAPTRNEVFLALATLAGVLVAGILCLPGTPAQDWDLMAICVLPALALGPAALRDGWAGTRGTIAATGLLLLSAGGLVGFVALNAAPSAGLRRFETLMSEAAVLSPHERAYGNEKLGNQYEAAGNEDRALIHFERALRADEANGRYWGKVGEAMYKLGRVPEAIPYFERALALNAPRGPTCYYLGYCYLTIGEPARAVPLFEEAARVEPAEPRNLGALGLALASGGERDRARAVFLEILKRWPDDEKARRAYRMIFGAEPPPP